MSVLIFYFSISILFSFLCSIWEAVLLSITPSYITRMAKEGKTVGKLLQAYKEDIDRPLSAILTLNTIAHTVGAMGVGAQAGKVFGEHFINVLGLSISAESLIAGVMTLAILILSEIIPKTLGANNWEALTPFTVKSLRALLWILAPLVWLTQQITKRMKKDKSKSVLSRSDYAAMTEVGAASGAIDKNESQIISNLLSFNQKSVKDIMTPKRVVHMANASNTVETYYEENKKMQYSRIPIFNETRDHIEGVVLKDDILQMLAEDKDHTTLKELAKPIHSIEEQTTLPDFFEYLISNHIHLAMINDSFGSVLGVVSMEDLFETLLGREIVDESDTVVDLQAEAKKQWEEEKSE